MALRPSTILLAALLMSAAGGGCGGSDAGTSPTITRTITRTATVSAATGTGESTTATTRTDGQACTNLPLPESVRSQLFDGKLDEGSVYYGRCGATYWATGYFTVYLPSGERLGGETYLFRRQRGRPRWEDLGGVSDDSNFCHVPRQLLRTWGKDRPSNCA